jgi:hypothetical protein
VQNTWTQGVVLRSSTGAWKSWQRVGALSRCVSRRCVVGIDWVALAWFLASAAGTIIAGVGIREGRADLNALGTIGNGRRIVATDYLRTQLGRFVLCLAWGIVGIPLLLDNQPVGLNVYTVVLIGGNIMLATMAALSLRDRRHLISMR